MAENDENLFENFEINDGGFEFSDSLDFISPTEENTNKQNKDKDNNKSDDDLFGSELQDFIVDTDSSEEEIIKKTPTASGESSSTAESPESGVAKADSPYAPFASALHEQGLLPNLDLEEFEKAEDKQEALFAAVNKEIEMGVEAFKESLPPELKAKIDSLQTGIPENKTSIYAQVEKLTIDSLEDSNVAKHVVKQNLIVSGLTQDKAEKYVNALSEEDLTTESETALYELKTRAVQEKQEAQRLQVERENQYKAQREETLKSIKASVDNTVEIIPGIKLNPNVKDTVFKSMTTPVGKDTNGRPINAVQAAREKDPIKFETTLHYLNALGVFEGKWDKIIKTQKTNAIKQLEESLSGGTSYTAGKGTPSTPSMEGSVLDILKDF